jgi:hypothetical protein
MSIFNGRFYENKSGKLLHLECQKCGFNCITSDSFPHSALEGECVKSVEIEHANGLRKLEPIREQDPNRAYFKYPAFFKMIGEPTVDVCALLKDLHERGIIHTKDINNTYLTIPRHVGDEILKYVHNDGYAGLTLEEYLLKLYPVGDSKPLVQLT